MAGHSVAAYASGVAFLADSVIRPVCVIIDQHMPQMTGLKLVSRLRGEGVTTPVLLITGSPSPVILAGATQLGIEKVLEKPFDENELWSLVDRHN